MRVINGSKTQLIAPDRLAVDPVHDEIYVPEGVKLLVFPRTANGNVAPIRVITGPDTGIGATRAVTVDPQRNLIIAATQAWGGDDEDDGAARVGLAHLSAAGERQRQAAARHLRPARDGQSRGRTRRRADLQHADALRRRLAHRRQRACRAAVHDWRARTASCGKGRGLALDAKSQAVIASDKELNAVMTFHVPEIFRQGRGRGTPLACPSSAGVVGRLGGGGPML